MQGNGKSLEQQSADGFMVKNGFAQIPVQQPVQPEDILDRQGLVEPELGSEFGHSFGGHVGQALAASHIDQERIAGKQAHDEKDHYGQRHDNHQRP